jgi:hypothetical protein
MATPFKYHRENPPLFDLRQLPREVVVKQASERLIIQTKIRTTATVISLIMATLFSVFAVYSYLEEPTKFNLWFMIYVLYLVLSFVHELFRGVVLTLDKEQLHVQEGQWIPFIVETIPLTAIEQVHIKRASEKWYASKRQIIALKGGFEDLRIGKYLSEKQTHYLGFALRHILKLTEKEEIDFEATLDLSQHLLEP